MSKHAYCRIWTHLLFSTKDEAPLITADAAPLLHAHLKAQLTLCRCPVKLINGTADHVHLLFLLHPEISLTDVVKQIKGNSSHWVNSHELIKARFAWQMGFNAFSVSDNELPSVIRHIQQQAHYHLALTYLQEVDEMISAHGLIKCG